MQAELLKGEWISALTGLLYAGDASVLPPAVLAVHRMAASSQPGARWPPADPSTLCGMCCRVLRLCFCCKGSHALFLAM